MHVAAQARRDLNEVAMAVIGKDNVDSAAPVKAGIETVRKTVADDQLAKAAKITADMPLADMLNKLYGLFRNTAEEAGKLQAERDDLTKQLEQALADLKAKSEAFDNEIARLTKQFEEVRRGDLASLIEHYTAEPARGRLSRRPVPRWASSRRRRAGK